MELFQREIALIGEKNFQKLARAHVAVFGIGGVGSYAAEALVRAGIGSLTFVDGDTVVPSNCNRQLIALNSTVGQNKAAVMRRRAGRFGAVVRFFALFLRCRLHRRRLRKGPAALLRAQSRRARDLLHGYGKQIGHGALSRCAPR